MRLGLRVIKFLGVFFKLGKKFGRYTFAKIGILFFWMWRIFLVWPYKLWLSTRRERERLLKAISPSRLLHQNWLPLTIIFFATGFILLNNFLIRDVNAGDFGGNDLLVQIVEEEFGSLTSESLGLPPGAVYDPSGGTDDGNLVLDEGGAIIKPQIVTTARGVRRDIEYYLVESGDTLSSIAQKFGISIATLLWENRLGSNSVLRIGQKLTILPSSGVSHRVAKGDTLAKIASLYKVTADQIADFNNIQGGLTVGQILVIPGGRPYVPPAPKVTTPTKTPTSLTFNPTTVTKLLWPTTARRVSQYFGVRHTGVDLANNTGTPIYAAEDGVVIRAGWNNGGYGNYIIIDHGQGLQTLYAHNSKLLVSVGDRVTRGQNISLMGSTGRSTGPHLHFEVIINGRRTNPFTYIR